MLKSYFEVQTNANSVLDNLSTFDSFNEYVSEKLLLIKEIFNFKNVLMPRLFKISSNLEQTIDDGILSLQWDSNSLVIIEGMNEERKELKLNEGQLQIP